MRFALGGMTAVERLISQQHTKGQIADPWRYPFALVALSWQQEEAHQIARVINQRHDFRWQSTTRTAHARMPSPPPAPAAFW